MTYFKAAFDRMATTDERLGQAFFNTLPEEAQDAIRRTYIDPFFKVQTSQELKQWIANYAVLQDGEVIALFFANDFIWIK